MSNVSCHLRTEKGGRVGRWCQGGRPTYLDNSKARAGCVCSRCGMWALQNFFTVFPIFLSFLLLFEKEFGID